jgi:hypothetical protein
MTHDTSNASDSGPPLLTGGPSHLRDRLGCECAPCREIRREGPRAGVNPMARLVAEAMAQQQAGVDAPVSTAETPRNARARMAERKRAAQRSLSARAKSRAALAARYGLNAIEQAILARAARRSVA